MMPTVLYTHPVEIVWLMVSLVVIAVTYGMLHEAVTDAAVCVANKITDQRKVVADANVRDESTKLGIGVIMAMVAAISLFLPPPPPNYATLPQSIVGIVGWIATGLLMVISSFMARVNRQKLNQYGATGVGGDANVDLSGPRHTADSALQSTPRPPE